MMDELIKAAAPLQGVALALALGLLIGIERGWSHRREAAGTRVAGIRTFALLGLAGGIAAEAGRAVSPLLTAVIVAAAGAALLVGYARSATRRDSLSATTTIVGVITLGVGLFAASDQEVLAAVIAAVTTLVLTLRRQLHAWLGRLSEAELHAVARFGLVSLAVLPVLPDADFGPYGAWNPRQIWLVVVLVSGLSLAGYAATKRFGASRGLLATAAAGAVVSSTAVTAALAARLRKAEGAQAVLAAGVALASAVMLARVLVVVGLLAPFALAPLAVLVVPAILVSAAAAALLLARPHTDGAAAEPPPVRNPFDIVPALLLAGFVMALSLVARWALDVFGDAGLATVLTLSGLLDVDSAVITVSALPTGRLDQVTAALVFAAPLTANTLLKAGVALGVAGVRRGWRAAAPLLLSVVAGALAWPVMAAMFG